MNMKKEKAFIGSAIAASIGITSIVVYKYLGHEINKEGSSLWLKYSSLEDIEKFCDKIGEQFKNAGLNNLGDAEYIKVESMKDKLDKYIDIIKNAIYDREHPNVEPVHREHGWYLPNKD